MAEVVIGTCRLCGRRGELQDSHIVPRWVYRRAVKGSAGKYVRMGGGVALLTSEQITEHLLCSPCEQRVGVWDGYAAQISVQDDGTFPGRDRLLPLLEHAGDMVSDATLLNVDALTRFAASVVWRASVSTKVRSELGPYASAFASYLRGESPVPDDSCLLVVFVRHHLEDVVESMVFPPTPKDGDDFSCHEFTLYGIRYRYLVGPEIPPALMRFCLARTRRAIINDGGPLLGHIERMYEGSLRKGTLAR